ncbi:MAG: Hydroxyneurosporene synthase (CrtC) [Syntrophorhabdus sp. PtaU1.Bin002]|nr:MAG: Hydroxyneurosporene synthase (CrtC) [Syntrophorhabdus sp. PtaU1.Bin002]
MDNTHIKNKKLLMTRTGAEREKQQSAEKAGKPITKRVRITIILTLFWFMLWGTGSVTPAEEWKQAVTPWQWVFPRDHGQHPEYRTEWWYFTGNLSDSQKRRYGYQLTFFRQAIASSPLRPHNPWSVRDVYLAHFALTDVSGKRFRHYDRASRTGPGLAGADKDSMNVWTLNWSARMKKNGIHLEARQGDATLKLDLRPRKPIVFHGEKGRSRKGPQEGQSSYYYSLTDLETTGTIKTPWSREEIRVEGTSWFDHEFGSNQLTRDQVGWDWFGLHLSDGRDLMVYFLRKSDGSIEAASSGTIIEKDGTTQHLNAADIRMDVLDRWTSPRSGAKYPSTWQLRIPAARIDITLAPLVTDQELTTTASTGITYWEGAVAGHGTSEKRDVAVEGYMELTGYAGSLGGVF